MDDFLFCGFSQCNIDNVMNPFKDYGPICNWEHSKGEQVYDFLGINIKELDGGVFKFYQTGLIQKIFQATGMEHFNGFPKLTKVESNLGTYENGTEVKRYCPNSYSSVIVMMFYLTSKTIKDFSFSFNTCACFIHNPFMVWLPVKVYFPEKPTDD